MIGLALLFVLLGWFYLSFWVWATEESKDQGKRVMVFIWLWIPFTLATGNMMFGLAGVCVSQMRKWTDDELIEMAVRRQARQVNVRSPDNATWREMAIEDSEDAVQKFLKDNPRCCAVRRVGGVWVFLTGQGLAEVEMNYERHPDRPPEWSSRYYKEFRIVNTCGKVLGRGYSTDTKTLETTKHIRK